MTDNEGMERILKSMQTSLHDQINALKSDVQRAVGDADTAVEISATLEKNLHELESGKYQMDEALEKQTKALDAIVKIIEMTTFAIKQTRILTGMNQVCLRLCILGIMKAMGVAPLQKLRCLELVSGLLKIHDDFTQKIAEATEVEQLESLANQFIPQYIDIKSKIAA